MKMHTLKCYICKFVIVKVRQWVSIMIEKKTLANVNIALTDFFFFCKMAIKTKSNLYVTPSWLTNSIKSYPCHLVTTYIDIICYEECYS